MIATRLLHFRSALGFVRGLQDLHSEGLCARGMMCLALDEYGDVRMQVAEDLETVSSLKVGMKLGVPRPFSGRFFYFDAIHPIGRKTAVVNGDRRIGQYASMADVAVLVSAFVTRSASEQSVFFGCAPHQPGSWWVQDTTIVALHERGFVEIVPTDAGLVARRTVDSGLYFLPEDAAISGSVRQWQRVFESSLGNILMVERRVKDNRLVLSCQHGLIEVNLKGLPKVKQETTIELEAGYAVIGRMTDGPFAVTRGEPRDWGLDDMRPAILLGSRGGSLKELGKLLRKNPSAI